MITFAIPGLPVGKGRARSAKTKQGATIHFTPEKTVKYESTVALFASQAMRGRALLQGALRLDLHIEMPMPKSMSKRDRDAALAGRLYPTKKPDTSNVLKAIEDAMNQVVYVDDTQIVDHHITKRYAPDAGRVLVTVILLEVPQ